MTLTGDYAKRATKSYKTHEAKALLAHVRLAIAQMDVVGATKEAPYSKLAQIANELEMAADYFDLYGENNPRAEKAAGKRQGQ